MGLVQFRAQKIKDCLPSMDRGECEAINSNSMVVSSSGLVEASDGQANRVGVFTSNSTNAGVLQHAIIGNTVGEKSTSVSSEIPSGVSGMEKDHSASNNKNVDDEFSASLPSPNVKERQSNAIVEEDRMEFDGGGDTASAF